MEAEFRRQNLHRLTMRVGALHLANAEGLSRTAPAGGIAYGYNGKVATFNARLRETPRLQCRASRLGATNAGWTAPSASTGISGSSRRDSPAPTTRPAVNIRR